MMGGALGVGLALGAGGIAIGYITASGPLNLGPLGLVEPWQAAFIITGFPGLLFAWLIFTVPEPFRLGGARSAPSSKSSITAFLVQQRKFMTFHLIGFGILGIASNALLAWTPAYMSRAFGWSTTMIGLALAFSLGFGGIIGMLANGVIVDFLSARGIKNAHFSIRR